MVGRLATANLKGGPKSQIETSDQDVANFYSSQGFSLSNSDETLMETLALVTYPRNGEFEFTAAQLSRNCESSISGTEGDLPPATQPGIHVS